MAHGWDGVLGASERRVVEGFYYGPRAKRGARVKRSNFSHGFSADIWNAAKHEAREAMIEVAGREDTISYSDLVQRIKSCCLEPQDPRLAHMLGEISSSEDAAGRGLLTVVVIHKNGDMKPGPGFFNWRNGGDEIRRTGFGFGAKN